MVAESAERNDTTFTNTGLSGNTEYHYQVHVLTKGNAEIESNQRSGRMHQLVDSMPLDMEDGGYVRLYMRNGNMVALVSEPQRIRLLFFDTDGVVIEEQVLLQHRLLNIAPRTVVLASFTDGNQYLGFVTSREEGDPFPGSTKTLFQTAVLLAFDDSGVALLQDYTLPPVDVVEVLPDFDLSSEFRFVAVQAVEGFSFDNLTLTAENRELVSHDFTSDDLGDWMVHEGGDLVARTVEEIDAVVEEGELSIGKAFVLGVGSDLRSAKKSWDPNSGHECTLGVSTYAQTRKEVPDGKYAGSERVCDEIAEKYPPVGESVAVGARRTGCISSGGGRTSSRFG